MYDHGCRKIAISGLPPIGCLPIQITAKQESVEDRSCIEDENSDAKTYNLKLARLLPIIQALLPGSKIVYADIYKPLMDMINRPRKYGEQSLLKSRGKIFQKIYILYIFF